MACLVQQNGLYYAQFFSRSKWPTRKRVALKTKRRRIAERLLSQLEDDYALGRYNPWVPTSTEVEEEEYDLEHIGDAVEQYLNSCSHLRPSTVRTYREILIPFSKHLGATFTTSNLNPQHVQSWLDSTKANDVTRRKYTSHIGYLVRFLVKHGVLETDVSKGVKLRRLPEQAPKSMSVEQELKIVETIHRYSAHSKRGSKFSDYSWLASIIRANVHLGLRRSELINLRWDHVHMDRRVLMVRNTIHFTTKSGKERVLPIVGQAFEELKLLSEAQDQASADHVFTREGHTLNGSIVSHSFLKFRRMAGLPDGVNFHSTRHTFASRLAERGVPVTVIKELMGHSTIATTERYMKVRPDISKHWIEMAFGN